MSNIVLRPATPTDQEWKVIEAAFGASFQRDVAKKLREAGNVPQLHHLLPVRMFAYPRWVQIVNEGLRRFDCPYRLFSVTEKLVADTDAKFVALFRIPTQ